MFFYESLEINTSLFCSDIIKQSKGYTVSLIRLCKYVPIFNFIIRQRISNSIEEKDACEFEEAQYAIYPIANV